MAITFRSLALLSIVSLTHGSLVVLAEQPVAIPHFETTQTEQKQLPRFSSGPMPDKSPQTGYDLKLEDHSSHKALNIGFAHDPGQGNYDGVVGSPSDVWNFVDIGTTAVDYLRHTDATSSTARLRVSRHDGEWGINTHQGIYHGYIYDNCQCVDLETTLLDLASGRYRAYIYAHGDAPNQNANIETFVGAKSLGTKSTTKKRAYQSRSWKEGNQFVTFEFDVTAGESVRFISHRDGSDYSMFNAIQLLPITPNGIN